MPTRAQGGCNELAIPHLVSAKFRFASWALETKKTWYRVPRRHVLNTYFSSRGWIFMVSNKT